MSERTQAMMPMVIEGTTYTPVIHYGFAEIERMAQAVAKSGMFGIKTPEQGVALMMLAQAEGMHPMIAARDYDIIQGRPSKKAEAMLRDFQRAGGSVQWHELSDTVAKATFSHPQGGSVTIDWTLDRAKKAGLGGKDMWSKFPRQMLRSRTVSEGCKTVWPSATSGMYTPEEQRDFNTEPERSAPMRDVTPAPQSANDRLQALQGALDTPPPVADKPRRGRVTKQPETRQDAQEPLSEPEVTDPPLTWIWIAPDGRFKSYDTADEWLEILKKTLPSKSADDCTKLMSRMNDTFNQLIGINRSAVEEAHRLINERFIEASNADQD